MLTVLLSQRPDKGAVIHEAMSKQAPFVFLASRPYSGSTLSSFLVNAHPEIASVGEMTGLTDCVNPNTYLCSCGDSIKECGFWRSVTASMRRRGISFDVADFGTRFQVGTTPIERVLRCGSLRNNCLESMRDSVMQLWPGHYRRMSEIAVRNLALSESVLEVTGKKVFFDASKHHLIIRHLQKYANLELKVVHLVRDVRGAVVSDMRHTPGISLRRATARWIQGNRDIERQLEPIAHSNRLRIHYEDLCRDTDSTLKRIFRFCGVDESVTIAGFRDKPSCIVGNYMRLSHSSEIRLDDRWKHVLTNGQLKLIRRMAGALQSRYGYASYDDEHPCERRERSLPQTMAAG